jgi:hypothetical protein
MIEWFAAFIGMFLVDILHAIYIKSVQSDRPYMAAGYSGTIYILASGVTISYVGNVWLLIPATIGAVAGTLAGVLVNKRYQI